MQIKGKMIRESILRKKSDFDMNKKAIKEKEQRFLKKPKSRM